jgi:heme-degrading monooxygenase HmoA
VVAVSERSPVVYIAVWEMEGDTAPVVAALAERTAGLRPTPEYAGAVWLARRPDFTAPQATGEASAGTDKPRARRIVEWIQWTPGPGLPPPVPNVTETVAPGAAIGGATRQQEEFYAVKGVVTASGSSELDVTPGAGGITLMLMGTSDRAVQACDFVMNEARENIRFLPGFIGGAFLLGHGGARMAELVRWESLAAFRNATTNNGRFRKRIEEAGNHAVVDGASYEILKEHTALT